MPFFARRAGLIGEAALATDKPVMIALTPGAAAEAPRRALRELGQFYFDRTEDALRVLALVADHDALRASPAPLAARPAGLPEGRALVLPEGSLTEGEVKRLLAAYDIPVATEHLAATPEAAAGAAMVLGFPVVVKAVSRRIVHKSDVGAVRLDLASPEEVTVAARTMRDTLRAAGLDSDLEGFSVQPMIRGEAEVIVGARRDPHFGAVVMVGLGGIAVELLNDVALAPAPVSPGRARALIAALRGAALLTGARGRPPVDVASIADVVARVSWLAADLGPRLDDLEINPLIVRRDGGGAVAVDARATLHPKEEPRP
jgi:acetyl-CoA synthetase (ADP-forming)